MVAVISILFGMTPSFIKSFFVLEPISLLVVHIHTARLHFEQVEFESELVVLSYLIHSSLPVHSPVYNLIKAIRLMIRCPIKSK